MDYLLLSLCALVVIGCYLFSLAQEVEARERVQYLPLPKPESRDVGVQAAPTTRDFGLQTDKVDYSAKLEATYSGPVNEPLLEWRAAARALVGRSRASLNGAQVTGNSLLNSFLERNSRDPSRARSNACLVRALLPGDLPPSPSGQPFSDVILGDFCEAALANAPPNRQGAWMRAYDDFLGL